MDELKADLPPIEPKRKQGQPTKYKEEYCDQLIDHMSEGFSFESFGGIISVSRDTLYEWAKVQPAFSDAKKIGLSQHRLYWERQMKEGMWNTPKLFFNTTAWIFMMKNCHGWRDNPEAPLDDEDLQFTLNYTLKKKAK